MMSNYKEPAVVDFIMVVIALEEDEFAFVVLYWSQSVKR
jgi:hypothetical protein